MSIFIAELTGTMLLILLGNGSVANVLLDGSKGKDSGWIVITTGWGFAVTVAVYTVGWISGAHINPAVTIGFAVTGRTTWEFVPYYLSGQIVGSMIGALLVYLFYLPQWGKTKESEKKLLCFCTKPILRQKGTNFLVEVIATAVLLIGILGIVDRHTHLGAGLAPYMIGILIWSIGLSLGGPTGFAINPARDLGPRLMHQLLPINGKGDSDWNYAWVPIIGPLIGCVLGAGFYHIVLSPLIPLPIH